MASDAKSGVAGTWRRKDKARGHPALLKVDSDGVASVSDPETGDSLAAMPATSVAISDRVGSIPRWLEFGVAGTFETADNDAVDRLFYGTGSRRRGFIHELERFRPRLVLVVLAVVALSFAIYRYAMPVLVEVAIAVTPPVVPQLMSQSVLASLDGSVFEPSALAADRQKAIGDGFNELKSLSPRGVDGYMLHFRKGGIIGPNAFALPDGTVILTDELADMTDDDEMILGVLAHEIGHVDLEHSLRQLYRAAGVTALIMMIGGDIGSGAEDLLVQGTGLLALSHSRTAEREADRKSVELMYRAGKDPAAIARFFELLRDKLHDTGTSDFFSTHPATPERIEETRRYAEEVKNNPDCCKQD